MALYEEMAPLQGVAVPRCYGLFEGVVRDALASVIPPKGQEQGQAFDKNRPRTVCGLGSRPTTINGVVSILLLERLDVHLPFEVPISADIRCALPTSGATHELTAIHFLRRSFTASTRSSRRMLFNMIPFVSTPRHTSCTLFPHKA